MLLLILRESGNKYIPFGNAESVIFKKRRAAYVHRNFPISLKRRYAGEIPRDPFDGCGCLTCCGKYNYGEM
jgi:hypothetical protein